MSFGISRIGIGRRIGIGNSRVAAWTTRWETSANFYEFWKVTGSGTMVGLKRGDELTITGSGLNAIYAVPNTAAYITRDTDYVFHKSDGSVSTACDGNRLIGYDFAKVIVKYLDVAPYTIEYIGILDTGQSVTDQMRTDFHLSLWWSNVLSAYGNLKGNRAAERSVWTPEVVVITDADGNEYTEVTIGTQTWLVEPLRTTKYNDGSAITNVTLDAAWAALSTEAYCWMSNDVGNKARGALYNWFAGNTNKLHITGYHIPSAAEFDTLNTYLNGISAGTQGGQMKTEGTSEWAAPNTGANNSSGFTGRPSGFRTELGAFSANQTQYNVMWVKEQTDASNAKTYYLSYNNDDLLNAAGSKKFGRTIHLIKD